MARPGRPRRPATRTLVAAEVITPWRRVPAVVRATRAIAKTYEAMARANTKAALSIGRHMERVREDLDEGEFGRWVAEALPFGIRTAHNYLGLLAWSVRAPKAFAARVHLGPTKLYRLATLSATHLRRLAPRVPIPLPDGATKTIEELSVRELDRVIGDLVPPPVVAPSPAKVLAAVRHRAAGLEAHVEQLVTVADAVSTDDVDDVIDRVGRTLALLRKTFQR